MQSLRVMLAGLMLLSVTLVSSCSCQHIATLPPAPVVGVDIAQVKKGDIVPFNGTEFSPFYLNEYLQWKNQ